MPSISQLEYIAAVDKLRHFGKAAELCHISQPTLSMQIQKVEEEIGFLIFDRLKKPVVPTEKGIRFIEQARVLLREHQKLMDLSRSQSAQTSGEFRLGVIPTVTPYLLPLFIDQFSKKYPAVHLHVDELKTSDILALLHEDKLDAGIMATPLHEPGLTEKPLCYEPFYFYVAKNNPLHSRRRIREDDLNGDEMWLLADGHCFRNQVVRFCSLRRKDGVFPNVQFEGGSLETLRNLIKKSQGYTLMPALFVNTLSEAERKEHIREFEQPVPTRELSVVYRRDQWKGDLLQALFKSIVSSLPPNMIKHDTKRQSVIPVG